MSWSGHWAQTRPSCVTQGRFTIAAKHHISIAEIYETELVDIEKVRGNGAPGRRQGAAAAASLGPPLCPVHLGRPLVTEHQERGVGTGRTWMKDSGCVPGGSSPSPLPVSPRPSPTTSSLQTTTRARSRTGTRGPHSTLARPAPQCVCDQPPPTSLTSLRPTQLSQQVSAEGGWVRGAAGAVSEGH